MTWRCFSRLHWLLILRRSLGRSWHSICYRGWPGFYDRPEIRDLLNILRALSDPFDELAFAGLLRSPAFGLSDAALYQAALFGIALLGCIAVIFQPSLKRIRQEQGAL